MFLTGAVLIGPRLVLSAAHCNGSDNEFRVGASSSTSDGEIISIKETILHPDYDPSLFGNDLMLSVLKDPTTVPYIQLEPNEISGGNFTVIGFGDTDSGAALSLSSVLREVELNYVDNDTCDANHGGKSEVREDMLCAIGTDKDSCLGDSGGRK
jgi:secreted trypsin-like serine protease